MLSNNTMYVINAKCSRKVHIVPGSPVVQCMSCNRKMLAKKCPMAINCHVDIAVDGQEKSLTIFGPQPQSNGV